jgi:uncharacterized protein YoxC
MNDVTISARNKLKFPLISSLVANCFLIVIVIGLIVFYLQTARDLEVSKSTVNAQQIEISGIKAQLSMESSRAAELKTDLNATRADVQSLTKQSTELKSANDAKELALSEEKNRTEVVQSALEKEKNRLPIIPVRIEFRTSAMKKGLVGVFTNYSSKQLTIMMALRNTTTGQTKQIQTQIAPAAKLEIGHLEGWQFASGDQIIIGSAGYESSRSVAP